MVSPEQFAANAALVRARVIAACAASGRDPGTVRILPVTKTHPAAAALAAHEAGFDAVGENRVAEAFEKKPAAPAALRWELIGHLQSNKARLAVETFDRIQSLDTPALAVRLGRLAGECGKTLPVLLQANAGGDPAKFGADFAGLAALLDAALNEPRLCVSGLMTIAPLDENPDVARRCFDTLRHWRDELAATRGVALPELSMGMSGDLEHAVSAGSTLLRIGSAFFGSR